MANVSISKRLLSHFREIEIIKKGNKIVGIKPFDEKLEFQNFEDELFLLDETPINAQNLLLQFENEFKNQGDFLTELNRILIPGDRMMIDETGKKGKKRKKRKITDADKIQYLTVRYSHNTNIEIINFRLLEGATLTDKFIDEFLNIMNLRNHYSLEVVRRLRIIVNHPSDGALQKSLLPTLLPNPNKDFFRDDLAFTIFNSWVKEKPEKDHFDYICFAYRYLIAENKYFVTNEIKTFINFMSKHYMIHIDKVKTLSVLTNTERQNSLLKTIKQFS